MLEARITYEDIAKRNFGEAVQEVKKQEDIRDGIILKRENHLKDMAARRSQPAFAEFFSQDIQYEWVLKMNINRQSEKVKKAEQKMERMRQKLVEAVKERKIMEKLRERQMEEFRKEQNKNEMKFADEIAGRKAQFETSSTTGD